MTNASSPIFAGRILPILLRLALLSWAGFWVWFVIAASLGEKPAPPLWIPLAWFGALGTLVFLCWKRPTLGGLVLTLASLWAAWFFANPSARALLAAPALVLGVGFLVLGWRRRVASGLALALPIVLGAAGLATHAQAGHAWHSSSPTSHPDVLSRRA